MKPVLKPEVTLAQKLYVVYGALLGLVGLLLVGYGLRNTAHPSKWNMAAAVVGTSLALLGEIEVSILADAVLLRPPRFPFWLNEWLFKCLFFGWFAFLTIAFRRIATSDIANSDDRLLWSIVLIVTFFLTIAYAYRYFSGVTASIWSTRVARRSAEIDDRSFVFLLRPFNVRLLFEHNSTMGIYGMDVPDATASVLPWLEDAISATAPLVVLGKTEGSIRDRQCYALELRSSENNWRTLFHYLADTCRALIIIPANTDGIRYELSVIVDRNVLNRCVFYQPPLYYWLPNSAAADKEEIRQTIIASMKSEWDEVRTNYTTLGILLPEFDPEGMFACFDNTKKMILCKQIGAPSGKRVSDVHREAFEIVMRSMNLGGVPLREAVSRIKELGGW